MRRRRRTILVGAVIAGATAVLLVPSLVAAHYASGPGGAEDVAGRPDRGWEFIVDAISQSRGARLGSGQSALERAREIWAGSPAVAESVRLTWMEGPFTAPVPAGGVAPAPRRLRVVPESSLGWTVTGRVRGGVPQMIGLLDYASGRVSWDIRPVPAP